MSHAANLRYAQQLQQQQQQHADQAAKRRRIGETPSSITKAGSTSAVINGGELIPKINGTSARESDTGLPSELRANLAKPAKQSMKQLRHEPRVVNPTVAEPDMVNGLLTNGETIELSSRDVSSDDEEDDEEDSEEDDTHKKNSLRHGDSLEKSQRRTDKKERIAQSRGDEFAQSRSSNRAVHDNVVLGEDPDADIELDDAEDEEDDEEEDEEPSFGEILKARGPQHVEVGEQSPGAFSDDDDDSASDSAASDSQGLVPRPRRKLSIPSGASLGTVLAQALRSSDTELLESCLQVPRLDSIRATIERLPSPLAVALLERLAERLHRRPGRAGTLMVWIQWTIVAHGGYLTSQPRALKQLRTLHRVVHQRATGLAPLLALKGKLDLLEAQLQLRRNRLIASGGGDESDGPVVYIEGQDDDENGVARPLGGAEGADAHGAPSRAPGESSATKLHKRLQMPRLDDSSDEELLRLGQDTAVAAASDHDDDASDDNDDDDAASTSDEDALPDDPPDLFDSDADADDGVASDGSSEESVQNVSDDDAPDVTRVNGTSAKADAGHDDDEEEEAPPAKRPKSWHLW